MCEWIIAQYHCCSWSAPRDEHKADIVTFRKFGVCARKAQSEYAFGARIVFAHI